MKTSPFPEPIKRALDEYEIVRAEYNRPKEDMVVVATCDMIKQSIRDFLVAYLHTKNEDVEDREVISGLHERCSALDDTFSDLDLTAISCLDEENVTFTNCMDCGRLHKCIRALDHTKEHVVKRLSADA